MIGKLSIITKKAKTKSLDVIKQTTVRLSVRLKVGSIGEEAERVEFGLI